MENNEARQIYDKYFDTVYRICFLYMKNESDAKDMTQEAFFRLFTGNEQFENEERIKAWLIITASNCCKTLLKKWWYKQNRKSESLPDIEQEFPDNSLKELVLSLEKKYSIPTYLYYYEGYKTGEIADMLHEKQSTIQTRLSKARELLKIELTEYENYI